MDLRRGREAGGSVKIKLVIASSIHDIFYREITAMCAVLLEKSSPLTLRIILFLK
jgi:3-isopropylmalate dehydratase small subunit